MKIITFPEDAELVSVFERMAPEPAAVAPARQKLTWRSVLAERLCDPIFGQSLDALHAQSKIFRASEKVGADRVLRLEDTDYTLLLRATETPSGGYLAAVGLTALPFFAAIKNATTE